MRRDKGAQQGTRPGRDPGAAAKFLASGDTALVVEFGRSVDPTVSELVLALAQRVEAAAIAGVVEVVPTFRSLMVHYDPLALTQAALKRAIRPMLDGLRGSTRGGRHWLIPTCYEESVGLDLAEVAARTGLTVPALVAMHSAASFRVYMMGFLPGFPYLGGLPGALELPRRETPRLRVPRGSVAIAMDMTCIYTLESPGGWHVLGRTPAALFDLRRDPPASLAAGDTVTFHPISLREYERLAAEAAAGGLAMRALPNPEPTR